MSHTLKILETVDVLQTMDAKVWAKEFCKTTGFKDEDWAFGWFANAIMKGYDVARFKYDPKIKAQFKGTSLDPDLQKNLESFLQNRRRESK